MKGKRISKGKVFILVLLALCLFILPAGGSFWVKGDGFYYSPDYGDLGDELEEVRGRGGYDTPLVLEAGSGITLSAGYDFSENWGIRLDIFSFTGTAEYHRKTGTHILLFETSTSPILASLIYRVSIVGKLYPYFGAGVGIFPCKLIITPVKDIKSWYEPVAWTDSPLGFQVLGGAQYRLQGGLFFSGEVRYISAKAEYPDPYGCIKSCSTDWSGIFANIGVGYRFK